MSATDLAAVLAAVTCLGVVAVAAVLAVRLWMALAKVDGLVHELRTGVDARLADLDARSAEIHDDLHRVDGLIDAAERVTARADTLSRMTYGAVAKPVIKTAAVVRGTSKAARRLKGVGGDPPTADAR